MWIVPGLEPGERAQLLLAGLQRRECLTRSRGEHAARPRSAGCRVRCARRAAARPPPRAGAGARSRSAGRCRRPARPPRRFPAARSRRADGGGWCPRGARAMYRPRRWSVSEDSPCSILGRAVRCGKDGPAAVPLSLPQPARATCSAASRTRQLAVVDPHVELVDELPRGGRAARARRSRAVFETHVQADHVSGLPALVEARSDGVPAGRSGSRVRTCRRSPTARSSSSGTRSCGRSPRPAMRRPTTPTSSRTGAAGRKSRGSSSRATRCSSATSAVPTCMPAATRSRPRDEQYALDRAPARASRSRARLPEPLRRLRLRARALGQPVLEHRLRAPPQRGARASGRGELRRSTARRPAAALRRTSARSSPPTAAG